MAGGVSDLPWAAEWLRTRAWLGLGSNPVQPALGADGMFAGSAMSTAQGTEWLKQFLVLALNPCGEAQRVGTHSLKATLLSWSAKRGLSGGERRLLGQHRKPKGRSVDVYSRDQLAPALRSLQRLLREVKDALFQPDASRS
eukprot:6477236-Amphidinium_carterae.1